MGTSPTGGHVPLGVYDTPAPDSAAPAVTSIEIPDTLGPLRLTEYGKGLRALTQARDWFNDLLG